VETSEDETTTTVKPHSPQSTLLEGEYTGQPSSGESELTTYETDHPDDDAKLMNHSRPSEDLADTMGNNKHHPDTPTEPPDMPEGAREQGRSDRIKMGVSRVSREVEGCAGIGNNKECWLGKPDKPSNKPAIEPRDPKDIQVEPGGKATTQ
jgi:hypothetical protein